MAAITRWPPSRFNLYFVVCVEDWNIIVYVNGFNITVIEDWNVVVYFEGWHITVIKDGNVIVIEGWIIVIVHRRWYCIT